MDWIKCNLHKECHSGMFSSQHNPATNSVRLQETSEEADQIRVRPDILHLVWCGMVGHENKKFIHTFYKMQFLKDLRIFSSICLNCQYLGDSMKSIQIRDLIENEGKQIMPVYTGICQKMKFL